MRILYVKNNEKCPVILLTNSFFYYPLVSVANVVFHWDDLFFSKKSDKENTPQFFLLVVVVTKPPPPRRAFTLLFLSFTLTGILTLVNKNKLCYVSSSPFKSGNYYFNSSNTLLVT
jgi:hypothetical protein